MKVNNTFTFVGKLSPIKDSEKLKGYDERTFDSGWASRTVNFNMTAGSNRHMLTVRAGKWADDSKATIRTFGDSTHDEKGNKTERERLEIPFAERLNPEWVEKVAPFRRFVLDLDSAVKRRTLKKISEDGFASAEDIAAAGIENISEAKAAYEKSLKKRHEFISEWDYCEMICKLLSSDKLGDTTFKVSGNIEFQYNPERNQFYRSFVPNRIWIADNTEPVSDGVIDFYFTKDAVDKEMADENGRYLVNGYTRFYYSSMKQDIGAPITMHILAENNPKLAQGLCKKLECDDDESYRHIGLKVKFVDGAQKVDITYDMLSDEQKESIDFGLCTLEDVVREMGGTAYGDREQYTQITGLAVGFTSGAEDCAFTEKDFKIPTPEAKTEEADDLDDLFDDDDDIL